MLTRSFDRQQLFLGPASRSVFDRPTGAVGRCRVGMTVDDPGEDVCRYPSGSMSFNLQVSISEATVAQCSAPRPNRRTAHSDDSVVIELDVAVIDETRQPFPP